MNYFGVVWVSRNDNGIYLGVLIVVSIIMIISFFFSKTNWLKNIFTRFSKEKDKVEGPISFGPDIFEFITMCVKVILNIFRR